MKRPVVVLVGEDSNDRRCLRTLLEEHCPDMRGRLVEINPSMKFWAAGNERLDERVDRLRKLVNARAAREGAEVACVFVHEDLDRADSSEYPVLRERVEKAMNKALGSAHYVLAVWETEAWLLLFPDALAAFVANWQLPARYRGRDTGRLSDPKRILMNEVSRSGRRYRESDAPEIFEKAREMRLLAHPVGSNRSWTQLCGDATRCCSEHLRQPAHP
ncbi:hypothetical protein [Acrocarpospora pleiomorpha]|uniref:hypothetical protein n=1 Tax=Acrocarpospora pleiomorpha TaxID=90975 RepID=UPI001FE99EB4|nr:hypothetical protein [Acrocarpospora pleiomorpha]